MSISTLQEILISAEAAHEPMWKIILQENCKEQNIPEEECFENMRCMYRAMKNADRDYDAKLFSASGMSGGAGEKLHQYRVRQQTLLGDYLSLVVEKAVKMAESNACMKRIVAAPTAGSCGVIPAVLLAYEEMKKVQEEELVKALLIAGGIGAVYAAHASIAGAEGGCQAEIGVASAMAAGAVAFLEGGDHETILHAATLAMKSLLGLTCDPVAGLVEVPCIKRNASGAVNAVTAAQLALSGIQSAIPPDEVVDSMRRIGKLLPECLRETSLDGLAATKTGAEIRNRVSKTV